MRQRRFLTLLIFHLLCSMLAAENFAEIFGQVVDGKSGGIASAKIIVDRKQEFRTDRWGFFNIEPLRKGRHLMRVEARGFNPREITVELFRDWNTVMVEMETQGEPKSPKEDAPVSMDISPELNSGEQPVFVDYWSESAPLKKIKSDSPFFSVFPQSAGPMLKDELVIKVKGKVCDANSGSPLFGAIIETGDSQAVTDTEGCYEVTADGSAPTRLKVRVSMPRYREFVDQVSVTKQEMTMDYLLHPESGEGI
ncbi:MAG: carboxypeptidase regulatory-like domain-containing protein [Candidatus Wallbacteria bacterium]|nr:carboxypeptidase regulatory-like domain-containing protein [Candidatus Wallbacteria bacterium]